MPLKYDTKSPLLPEEDQINCILPYFPACRGIHHIVDLINN